MTIGYVGLSRLRQSALEAQRRQRFQQELEAAMKANQTGPAFNAYGKVAGCGRKPALGEEQRGELMRLHRQGNLTVQQLARHYGISRMTVYRVIKENGGMPSGPGDSNKRQMGGSGNNS